MSKLESHFSKSKMNLMGVSCAVIKHGCLVETITTLASSRIVYQVASLSKTLNALGALILVQEDKIFLDVDVNDYLKSWKISENLHTYTNKVTLRLLLSHTAGTNVSGFPGYHRDASIPSLKDILNGKKPYVNTEAVTVILPPGSAYQYSGGGSTVVQCLIEDVTGQPYDAWMKQNVLSPLGMNDSFFGPPQNEALIAVGHDLSGIEIDGGWRIHPESAAAGLWTHVHDMARLLQHMNDMFHRRPNTLLSHELFSEMIAPQATSVDMNGYVGLGLFMHRSEDKFYLRNAGANIGYSSVFALYPAQESGFVILTDRDDAFDLIDEIGEAITIAYNLPPANFND